MFIPFNDMASSSRIWIYQSNRPFSKNEVEAILSNGQKFFEDWAAHGNPLKSSVTVEHNQFIIVALDENHNEASGCSIDSSVHFISEVEKGLGVSLLDRTKVAYLNNNIVGTADFLAVKNEVVKGAIEADTLIFNNQITTMTELKEKWLVPASESWMKKYFKTHAVN